VPLVAVFVGLVEVGEGPAGEAKAEARGRIRQQALLSIVPAGPAGAVDVVRVPKDLVPACRRWRALVREDWDREKRAGASRTLTVGSRSLENRPGPVGSRGADGIGSRAINELAAKLEIHRVVRVISVATVQNAIHRGVARVLVEGRRTVG
jgi:hypothetical protein